MYLKYFGKSTLLFRSVVRESPGKWLVYAALPMNDGHARNPVGMRALLQEYAG